MLDADIHSPANLCMHGITHISTPLCCACSKSADRGQCHAQQGSSAFTQTSIEIQVWNNKQNQYSQKYVGQVCYAHTSEYDCRMPLLASK